MKTLITLFSPSRPLAFAVLAALGLGACSQSEEAPGPPHAERPAYTVSFDPARPQDARVELRLPASDRPLRLFSRAPDMQLEPQVEDVRCDGTLIERAEAEWTLPPGCETASWRVAFEAAERGAVRPSRQRSVSVGNAWAVLSGPTSLLRVSGFENETLPVALDGVARPDTLPPLNAAPGFFVLGDPPSIEYGDRSPHLTYIADDLQAVEALADPALHYQAIDYLRDAIGPAQISDVEDLTVVWFGAEREHAEMSGAAGFDTLIANYILAGDSPTPFEAAAPFILVLHEQFHQLAVGATPHWVSESLANYYALKAAGRILPGDEGVLAARAMFINPEAPVETGLLEIQRRINEDGDYSGYMQFYSTGAAFWASLDEALADATDGAQTLDDILPVILASDYSGGAGLPDAVMDALSAIPPEPRAAIFDRYL